MFRDPSPDTSARLRKDSCHRSPKVKPTRKTLLRLLSFARPYWWQLGLLMGASFVSSTLNLTYPALVGTVIDSVVTGNVTALHTIVFFLLALFTILPEFGFDIRPVLAGVGITGIALGLGAQTLVKDTLNGIFILAENQYAKGDVVTIAGVTGTVEDVSLRRTCLRDVDGVIYTVPNSSVVVAANYTRDFAKVRVTVPVAAASDLAKVRELADGVGQALSKDAEYGDMIITAPAYLRVDSIDANGVAVQVNGTVKPGSQWEVAGVLRARLLEAFQKAGVKTPWG